MDLEIDLETSDVAGNTLLRAGKHGASSPYSPIDSGTCTPTSSGYPTPKMSVPQTLALDTNAIKESDVLMVSDAVLDMSWPTNSSLDFDPFPQTTFLDGATPWDFPDVIPDLDLAGLLVGDPTLDMMSTSDNVPLSLVDTPTCLLDAPSVSSLNTLGFNTNMFDLSDPSLMNMNPPTPTPLPLPVEDASPSAFSVTKVSPKSTLERSSGPATVGSVEMSSERPRVTLEAPAAQEKKKKRISLSSYRQRKATLQSPQVPAKSCKGSNVNSSSKEFISTPTPTASPTSTPTCTHVSTPKEKIIVSPAVAKVPSLTVEVSAKVPEDAVKAADTAKVQELQLPVITVKSEIPIDKAVTVDNPDFKELDEEGEVSMDNDPSSINIDGDTPFVSSLEKKWKAVDNTTTMVASMTALKTTPKPASAPTLTNSKGGWLKRSIAAGLGDNNPKRMCIKMALSENKIRVSPEQVSKSVKTVSTAASVSKSFPKSCPVSVVSVRASTHTQPRVSSRSSTASPEPSISSTNVTPTSPRRKDMRSDGPSSEHMSWFESVVHQRQPEVRGGRYPYMNGISHGPPPGDWDRHHGHRLPNASPRPPPYIHHHHVPHPPGHPHAHPPMHTTSHSFINDHRPRSEHGRHSFPPPSHQHQYPHPSGGGVRQQLQQPPSHRERERRHSTARSSPNNNHNGLSREEAHRLRTVFVGDISIDISEREIQAMFSAHGVVESMRLFLDRHYCFVTFESQEEADQAIDNMNGYCCPDGNRLRVSRGGRRTFLKSSWQDTDRTIGQDDGSSESFDDELRRLMRT